MKKCCFFGLGLVLAAAPWLVSEECNRRSTTKGDWCGSKDDCKQQQGCPGEARIQLWVKTDCTAATGSQYDHCVDQTVNCVEKKTCGPDEDGICVPVGTSSYVTETKKGSPSCTNNS